MVLSYDFNDFQDDVYGFNEVAEKHEQASFKDLKKQLDLIKEELKEMDQGLQANDPEEVLDGVIDVLVTTLGFAQKLQSLGMDITKAMEITAKNNWSKFPVSEAIAIETAEMYDRQGIDVEVKYSSDYDLFIIKDENDKIRKPSNFVSNDLKSCVPEELMKKGFEGYANT